MYLRNISNEKKIGINQNIRPCLNDLNKYLKMFHTAPDYNFAIYKSVSLFVHIEIISFVNQFSSHINSAPNYAITVLNAGLLFERSH